MLLSQKVDDFFFFLVSFLSSCHHNGGSWRSMIKKCVPRFPTKCPATIIFLKYKKVGKIKELTQTLLFS